MSVRRFAHCIVRQISPSFQYALTLNTRKEPINIALAHQQHKAYVEVLRKLIPNLIELPGEPDFPDCCFVEDTVVVIGQNALLCRPGAPQRRGEVDSIEAVLRKIPLQQVIRAEEPVLIDGGDVLFTGSRILVGISKRTNKHAVKQLEKVFPYPIIPIRVLEGLHLKSVVTCYADDRFVVASNSAGDFARKELENIDSSYDIIRVPDAVPSNVIRIGNALLLSRKRVCLQTTRQQRKP